MIQAYLPSLRAGFRNGVDPTQNTSPRLSEELIVKHRKVRKNFTFHLGIVLEEGVSVFYVVQKLVMDLLCTINDQTGIMEN